MKKVKKVRTVTAKQPGIIIEFGVVFFILAVLILVAYVAKFYT